MNTCHHCLESPLREIASYSAISRIASDSTFWKTGGSLGVCNLCGSVQKPVTEEWKAEIAAIYDRYNIYHVSGGQEQQVFDAGSGLSRSLKLVRFLEQHAPVTAQNSRHLDIGCGNGAFLRGISSRFPTWKLFGSEVSDKYKSEVLSIKGVEGFFTQDLSQIPGVFDSISLVHVLEHIAFPVTFLKTIRSKLSSKGVLFVEVPYFVDNPFDLLIADHSSHFTPTSLRSVVARAGFEVAAVSNEWVPKELSLVAKPGIENASSPDDPNAMQRLVERSIAWLEQLRAMAIDSRGHIGVFGTSNAAAWLHGQLGEKIGFFVDEDRTKIGRVLGNKQILSPEEVPTNSAVIFPLPYPIAKEVSERLKGKGLAFEMLLPRPF